MPVSPRFTALLYLLLILAATSAQSRRPTMNGRVSSKMESAGTRQSASLRVIETYGKLPLSFEANQGQTDSQVKFLSRGNGYSLFLTSTEAVLALQKPGVGSQQPEAGRNPQSAQITQIPSIAFQSAQSVKSVDDAVVQMMLVGANPAAQVIGLGELPGKSNYFIGNDPKKWRTNVPTYAKVRYENVYPGIDLIYYGNQRQLEYDFVVAPGADPRAIRLAFQSRDREGAEAHRAEARLSAEAHPLAYARGSERQAPSDGSAPLRIDAQGDLVLEAEGSELRLHHPVVYQEVNGVRQRVGGKFVIQGDRQVGIEVARYDASKPLIIDPALVYSTYLGGIGSDQGDGIAVDSSGNAYVTGWTTSTNFPTANAFQGASGGGNCGFASPSPCPNAFVTKLNAAGSALVYSTYLGGNASDYGTGIAVDSSGKAYVTGYTQSTNFPTANAFQAAIGGVNCLPADGNALCQNAFVTKLNATGSALEYSTYLGGSNPDQGSGIAVDFSGNAYVTGSTTSKNFPTANAFQAALGGSSDAFVTKLNAAGSALVYSTYLGGNLQGYGSAIAVDSSGNAYVTGSTTSTNFPTTANALQPGYGGTPCIQEALPPPCGPWDAFVTKLNAAGSALVYSTYLGVGFNDFGTGIAVDSSGNAYVTGSNAGVQRPTGRCLDPGCAYEYSLVSDAFVTKLNATGSAQDYFTHLGSNSGSVGSAIAVDSSGNAYVTGETPLTDFPTVANAFQGMIGSAFATEVIAEGSALVYYIGGTGPTGGLGIAVDSSGNAYVTGSTSSSIFPTANAFQAALGGLGAQNAFVTKFPAITLPLPVLSTTSLGFSSYVTGPNPSNQTVTISSLTNIESGTLTWAATVTSGSWLSVSPASGIGNGTLTVSVNISGLPSGAYTGTIQVAAPNTPNSQEALTVTLNLAPPPSISPSFSFLSFVAYQGGPNPSVGTLKINNPGGGTLQWTATISSITGGNWLTISPASGNQTQALSVSVNIAGLTPQTYMATILVAAPNISSSSIPVTLKITPAPNVAVSPATLMFVGQVGGAVSPSQTVSISNTGGGSPLNWTATIISGAWLAISPTSGANDGTLAVSVNISGLAVGTYNGTIQVAATGSSTPVTVPVTLEVITPGMPVVSQNGIVNGASFAAGAPVAPGSIISIFGSNLATSTLTASSTPLPTTLLTTSAKINGVPVPFFYVSPTQINAQVPFEIPPGPATLVVTENGVSSPAVIVLVAATAPGIFQYGANRAVAQNPDGSINASNNPAKPGDVIAVYMTGQGAVSNPPPDGTPALGSSLSQTVATTTATIGGVNAGVIFSGLAPGFVGLLQVNLQIPNVAAGDQPLVVTIGGAAGNSALITVASQ